MDKNLENLRLLGVFYYVVAAFAAMIALIPMIYFTIGSVLLVVSLFNLRAMFPLTFVGGVFVLVASFLILLGAAFGTCLFFAGRFLRQARHYYFCLVTGGVACVFFPWGTILGVFTLVLLSKEEVKALFTTEE